MSKYWLIAICGLVCTICGVVGCRKPAEKPKPPQEVQDKRISINMSRIGDSKEFLVEAQYDGNLDMTWWIQPDADLYDAKGKYVPRPKGKAGTGWFHWKEDNESTNTHFAFFRSENPLKETLVLDTKELAPGKYRALPSVSIFEDGKDAHPAMKDPYYRGEQGIRPGTVHEVIFYIK